MANTYTLISSNVLSSSAASVTFSSIPSTYTDLVVRISARTAYPATYFQLDMTINGNTSALYSKTQMQGFGSGGNSSVRDSGQSKLNMEYQIVGANATANTFSNMEIYIPNYTGTSNTPIGVFSVTEDNSATGAATVGFAGLFRGSAAITSLFFAPPFSQNILTGSSFYLYGIRSS